MLEGADVEGRGGRARPHLERVAVFRRGAQREPIGASRVDGLAVAVAAQGRGLGDKLGRAVKAAAYSRIMRRREREKLERYR